MRMLIIRPGAIGDTLLTFPIIQTLRTRYAARHITFVGNAAVLALAQSSGLVEETFDYEDTRWGKLFLESEKVVIRQDAVLERSDVAIAWLRDPDGIVERNLCLYMHDSAMKEVIVAPGHPAAGERIHIVEYLARTAGLPRSPLLSWSLFPPPSAQQSTAYFAIHPGSGGIQKCWPIAHFASVITALWQHSIPVLLLAGPADHQRLADLRSHLATPPHPDMLNTLIDAPLLTVARQLRQCRGYLGNDSGITHLVAMLGIPTTVLFGPSDPVVWRPLGPQVNILHEPNLEQLPVDVVLQTISNF